MAIDSTRKAARFQHTELRRFMTQVLQRLGLNEADATVTAEALIEADLMGIDSHGVAQFATRSRLYIEGLQKGLIKADARPAIVAETATQAVVDADWAMGQVAAAFAQELAMSKAREMGMGAVTVRNSHHFGAAGFWALKAAREGMIGVVCQNGGRLVVPAGGKERVFGSNPIAVAVPSEPNPFLMDFATSAVSLGKVQIAQMQGRSVPLGWVVDGEGKPSTDPNIFQNGGALLPLGSTPELSWHKGYALAMVAEMLGGVLSAGFTGLDSNFERLEHCHFHLAIRVEGFRPLREFISHMSSYQQRVRASTPVDPSRPVVTAGDLEFATREERLRDGVPLHESVVSGLEKLAEELSLEFPKQLS